MEISQRSTPEPPGLTTSGRQQTPVIKTSRLTSSANSTVFSVPVKDLTTPSPLVADDGDDCPICLEPLSKVIQVKTTICSHRFCKACLQTILTSVSSSMFMMSTLLVHRNYRTRMERGKASPRRTRSKYKSGCIGGAVLHDVEYAAHDASLILRTLERTQMLTERKLHDRSHALVWPFIILRF